MGADQAVVEKRSQKMLYVLDLLTPSSSGEVSNLMPSAAVEFSLFPVRDRGASSEH